MAISAAVTLSKSSASVNMPVVATVTITNSGGAAVTVTSIQPIVQTTNFANDGLPAAIGVIAQGPGINLAVPGSSGTLALGYSLVGFAPAPASGTYTVGALVYTSDGSVTSASTASLTVTALSIPDST